MVPLDFAPVLELELLELLDELPQPTTPAASATRAPAASSVFPFTFTLFPLSIVAGRGWHARGESGTRCCDEMVTIL